jgi:hypothetical protein
MPIYRAYPVSKNHEVAAAPSVAINCENDQYCIQKAQHSIECYDIEIWDGPRFVARLKATP